MLKLLQQLIPNQEGAINHFLAENHTLRNSTSLLQTLQTAPVRPEGHGTAGDLSCVVSLLM